MIQIPQLARLDSGAEPDEATHERWHRAIVALGKGAHWMGLPQPPRTFRVIVTRIGAVERDRTNRGLMTPDQQKHRHVVDNHSQ